VIVARADASQRVGESSHRHPPPFTTPWRAPSTRSERASSNRKVRKQSTAGRRLCLSRMSRKTTGTPAGLALRRQAACPDKSEVRQQKPRRAPRKWTFGAGSIRVACCQPVVGWRKKAAMRAVVRPQASSRRPSALTVAATNSWKIGRQIASSDAQLSKLRLGQREWQRGSTVIALIRAPHRAHRTAWLSQKTRAHRLSFLGAAISSSAFFHHASRSPK
jgi:hypothetical protein